MGFSENGLHFFVHLLSLDPGIGRYPSKDSESSIDSPVISPRAESSAAIESKSQLQPVALDPVDYPYMQQPDYQKCATKIQAAYRGHRARGELCASAETQQ